MVPHMSPRLCCSLPDARNRAERLSEKQNNHLQHLRCHSSFWTVARHTNETRIYTKEVKLPRQNTSQSAQTFAKTVQPQKGVALQCATQQLRSWQATWHCKELSLNTPTSPHSNETPSKISPFLGARDHTRTPRTSRLTRVHHVKRDDPPAGDDGAALKPFHLRPKSPERRNLSALRNALLESWRRPNGDWTHTPQPDKLAERTEPLYVCVHVCTCTLRVRLNCRLN